LNSEKAGLCNPHASQSHIWPPKSQVVLATVAGFKATNAQSFSQTASSKAAARRNVSSVWFSSDQSDWF